MAEQGKIYYDSELRRNPPAGADAGTLGEPIRFAAPDENQAAVLSRVTVTEADGDVKAVIRMVGLVMKIVDMLVHPDDANWLDSRILEGKVEVPEVMAQLAYVARKAYGEEKAEGTTDAEPVQLVD